MRAASLDVVVDPSLGGDGAWLPGRNPPPSGWDAEFVEVAPVALADGTRFVTVDVARDRFWDRLELWFSAWSDATQGAQARVYTQELQTGFRSCLRDLSGTVRWSGAGFAGTGSATNEPDALVFEYDLLGWQSGSDPRVRGKVAIPLR